MNPAHRDDVASALARRSGRDHDHVRRQSCGRVGGTVDEAGHVVAVVIDERRALLGERGDIRNGVSGGAGVIQGDVGGRPADPEPDIVLRGRRARPSRPVIARNGARDAGTRCAGATLSHSDPKNATTRLIPPAAASGARSRRNDAIASAGRAPACRSNSRKWWAVVPWAKIPVCGRTKVRALVSVVAIGVTARSRSDRRLHDATAGLVSVCTDAGELYSRLEAAIAAGPRPLTPVLRRGYFGDRPAPDGCPLPMILAGAGRRLLFGHVARRRITGRSRRHQAAPRPCARVGRLYQLRPGKDASDAFLPRQSRTRHRRTACETWQ